MAVSYKKLWELFLDEDMKKKNLCTKAGAILVSVTKMAEAVMLPQKLS